jgi:hypothetical protein
VALRRRRRGGRLIATKAVAARAVDVAVAAEVVGYTYTVDDECARSVVAAAEDLTELFRLAAAAGEAIIVATSA